MPVDVSTVLRCLSDTETTCQSEIVTSPIAAASYIQNATLLTFMPPFILIYMYMFELILISQLHPYENTEKKAKNTDWILKQLLEKKKKRNRKQKEKGHLFLKF